MLEKNRSVCLPLLVALTIAFQPIPGRAQDAQPEVYSLGGDQLVDFQSEPANPLPVLFVHGHNLTSDSDLDRNYEKNWVDRLCDLPSFDEALGHNPRLDIEAYYLRFEDQHRPVEDDAAEIARAVDLILHRHDPSYDPQDPDRRTNARVAVIALSKGTISTRLYLKWLDDYTASGCDGSRDLPCVKAGFNPVSEFIAIAPPNHGLRNLATSKVKGSYALSQLNNGYGKHCLIELEKGLDFIENLNGHSICDTFGLDGCLLCPCQTPVTEPRKVFPSEAPLSRAPEAPGREGILYLTLFAEGNGDEFAGGEELSKDCQGRKLALNLSPDAVNIALPAEGVDSCPQSVHALTVHWPATICRALYTAAHHRVPPPDFRCQGEDTGDRVPEITPPPAANAMLALDLSGSMNGRPCPDCGPKVQYLREAVELFTELWQVVARPQDRIGAVYFRSEAEPFPVGGEALGPVGTRGAAILADLAQQAPSGLTAMGGALHSAIWALRELPAVGEDTRHVILFTDGMQNRNPMVLETGDGKLVIADDPSRHPLPTELAPVDLDDLAGIKIHTIGVGAGDPFKELLEKIARRTGGRFRSSLDIGDLRRFFVEQVIDVMEGFSPQLASYRGGSTGEDGHSLETFEIDGGAHRVIFLVSFGSGGELELLVEKNGLDLTGSGSLIRGSFYRILAFDLPLEVGGRKIESGGRWRLLARSAGGEAQLPYETAAIVDGAAVHHEASLGTGPHVAGRPLEMTVGLTFEAQPLTGAEVSARVLRSSTALGTLLATTPMPSGPVPALEAEVTGGQRKLQALVLDTTFWSRLEPFGARVELTDQGDGTYRGAYDATSVPGTYEVTFDIRGTDGVGRTYRRTETLSAQVEIGELDPDRFRLELHELERTAGATSLKLVLEPRDRFGNYLGPDYGDRIRVDLEAGTAAPVADLWDGSYEIALSVPRGSDPELELELLGRPAFRGPLSAISSPAPMRRLSLVGYLGRTFPTGLLDHHFDPGLLAELGLEYDLSSRLALNGVIGRYGFDPDLDIEGATLYLRYHPRWPAGSQARLFAEIGPGIYDPDGLDPAAGLSAGLGVRRPLRRRLEGEVSASYFRLFNSGDDLAFAALKVGLRWTL
ncbi:MAG: hypothetical protein KDD47_05545 [Acidobacteria bacterium]|nr:hypothetical protein [Acidobacteriota bacterium]